MQARRNAHHHEGSDGTGKRPWWRTAFMRPIPAVQEPEHGAVQPNVACGAGGQTLATRLHSAKKGVLGAHGQAAEDGAHALLNIVARHLAGLDVHVHAAEVADCPAVEQVAQGDQRGGLAGLPWRVQHEIPPVLAVLKTRMARLWHVSGADLLAGGLQRPDGHSASVAFNLLAEALAPLALPVRGFFHARGQGPSRSPR